MWQVAAILDSADSDYFYIWEQFYWETDLGYKTYAET